MPGFLDFAKGIAPVLGSGLQTAAAMIMPRVQYKWNKRAAEDSNTMNRENALWALEQNKKIQEEQRLYDSPAEQMKRYKDAGLNPALIYGGGAAASGGTFPVNFGSIAPSRVDAPQVPTPDPVGSYMRLSQMSAQNELTEAKTLESGAKTEFSKMQRAIAATNPMLDPGVYNDTIFQLQQVANLKGNQAMYMRHIDESGNARYTRKIDMEIEKMAQEIGLNTSDLAIKNKILQSKEYQNALMAIQKKWMEDGDITPQHIYQGIMLLLGKMLGK